MPISRFPIHMSVQLVLILTERSPEERKKITLLAAMQPQNFLEAINGQAVDSYS